MTDYIELKKLNNNRILATKHAQFADDPRSWDNFGTMLCFKHRNYTFGDKQTSDVEDVESIINSKKHISLRLRVYDHSGVSMSTSNAYPYNDYWDSAFAGIIYVSLEDIRKEFSIKRVTKGIRAKAIEILEAEVKLYSFYMEGSVYDYDVYTYVGSENFEELDLDEDEDEMKKEIQYNEKNFELDEDYSTEYFGCYFDFVKEVTEELNAEEQPTKVVEELVHA